MHIWKLLQQKTKDPEKQIDGWMDAPWLVEVILTSPPPARRACLLKPLILGCFRGRMSLLVIPFLVCYGISCTQAHLAGPGRRACCDGSELAKREEPVRCIHRRGRCTDNRQRGNPNKSIKARESSQNIILMYLAQSNNFLQGLHTSGK